MSVLTLEDVKDPNIVLVGKSDAWDANRRPKYWLDLRTMDATNKERYFLYSVLLRDPKGGGIVQDPLLLPREEAGKANVPPPGTKQTLEAYPVPVRQLKPGEQATIDPFGKILISDGEPEDDLTTMEAIMRLAKEIGEVKALLRNVIDLL